MSASAFNWDQSNKMLFGKEFTKLEDALLSDVQNYGEKDKACLFVDGWWK